MDQELTLRAKSKPHIEQPLSLPPAPVELGEASVDLAAAESALKAAERSLHHTRNKTDAAGKPIATRDEVAKVQRLVDEARDSFEAVRARRDRLRRQYEAQCREALGPALAALDDELRGAVDLTADRLARANSLRRQAAAAGISLGRPVLTSAEQLTGLLNYFLTVLGERR